MNISEYTIPDKQFEEIYSSIKKYVIFDNAATPVHDGNPIAVVLGGQPGAGKGNAYDYYNNLFEEGIVAINCDDFRQYHPFYKQIYDDCLNNNGNPSLITNKFVYDISDRLISELSDEHYNMVIESTLRSPDVAKGLVDDFRLKEKGYQVHLSIVGTNKEISLQGTISRYNKQLNDFNEGKTDVPPRSVPKDFHDSVVQSIPFSLENVYNSGLMDEIKIFNRDNNCFYSMSETPELNPTYIFNALAYNSPEEAKKLINNYTDIFSNKENERAYLKIKDTFVEKKGITSVENPTAVILGGLPGSGKGNIYGIYDKKLNNNVVHVDCDIFRKYYPFIDKDAYTLEEIENGKYAADTNPFVSAVEKRLMMELSMGKYNFIVESALKTPNTAFYAADTFKPMGYKVELSVMGTSIEEARKGTYDRYNRALEIYNEEKVAGLPITDVPRPVPDSFFDLVKGNIENSFSLVYKAENSEGKSQTSVDDITIFNRSGEVLYHMADTPDLDPTPILGARLHNSEENSREIINQYISSFQNSKLRDNMLETMGNDVDTYVKFLKFKGTMYKQTPKVALDFFVQNSDIKYLATETQWKNIGCSIKPDEKAVKGIDKDGNQHNLYDISQVDNLDVNSLPKVWKVDSSNVSELKNKLGIDENSSLLNGVVRDNIQKDNIVDCAKKLNIAKTQIKDFALEYTDGVKCIVAGRLEFGGNKITDFSTTNDIFRSLDLENKMEFLSSVSQNASQALYYVESVVQNLSNEIDQTNNLDDVVDNSIIDKADEVEFKESIDDMIDDIDDDYGIGSR